MLPPPPRPPHPLDVTLPDGTVRRYEAFPFDQNRKKVFAAWVYGKYREIARLEHEEDGTGDEEYEKEKDYLRQLHFRGEFGFLSERGGAAACTPDGGVELVRVIFDLKTTEDALELLALAGDQADDLVGLVLKESFPQATEKRPVDEAAKKKRLEVLAAGYVPVRRPR